MSQCKKRNFVLALLVKHLLKLALRRLSADRHDRSVDVAAKLRHAKISLYW